MPSGSPSPLLWCTATSKGRGQRCRNAAIPFGSVCRFHGGYTPGSLALARRNFERYVRFGSGEYEALWYRNQRIRSYLLFEERQAVRLMRKNGMEPAPKKRRGTSVPPPTAGPARALTPISYSGFDWEL